MDIDGLCSLGSIINQARIILDPPYGECGCSPKDEDANNSLAHQLAFGTFMRAGTSQLPAVSLRSTLSLAARPLLPSWEISTGLELFTPGVWVWGWGGGGEWLGGLVGDWLAG